MFDVTFYSFAKKSNSTARPTGTGTTIQCKAKGPLDKLAPVLVLQLPLNTIPTYNYAVFDGRYYRINGWTNVGALWEVSMEIDALATWKTGIGNQTIYVYRSSASYNLNIQDNLYPITSRQRKLTIAMPRPFTVSGAADSGAAQGTGVFVLGILNGNGMDYYGFTNGQLAAFMDYLFSTAYYEAVLTEFGAVEYPEAKVAINPMQYIGSAKYLPMAVSTPTSPLSWAVRATNITGINVGGVLLQNQSGYVFKLAGQPVDYSTTILHADYPLTSDFFHPQADERGNWLNLAPYSRYEINFPPFGLITLDPAALASAEVLRLQLTIDIKTCQGLLDLITDPGTANERTITRLQASIACDIPLSNIMTTGTSSMALAEAGLSGISAAVNLNPGGTLDAERAAVQSIVSGYIPHLFTTGGPGSTAGMSGKPALYVTQWYMSDDDLDGRGRPLCAKRRISAIPGYIMGDPDEISLACSGPELATIRAAIANGFYWE